MSNRTRNSAINAGVGIASQVLLVALSFLTRTVFIAQLGAELLGVQTLLTSVLAVLAVADLGISGALMYALYRPLSEGDSSRVSALVRHGGVLYRRVALVVGFAGILFLPFLDSLVNSDNEVAHLHVYFLIMLVDAVATYLMAHRVNLLNADQRMYLARIWMLAFACVRTVAQVVALLATQSLVVFLIIQALFTVLTNVFIYLLVGRKYPYIRRQQKLPAAERLSLGRSIRAMLVYRLGGAILHSSDPILISVIVGTVSLGYYANYSLIVGSFIMLLEIGFASLFPSVGNLLATGNRAGALRVLGELTLLSTALYGMIAVALVACVDQFIGAWLGDEFVLEKSVLLALALNFYVVGTMAPIWAFRGATGMFRETQYVFLLTAALNVVLSVVLGQLLGITGVLLATAVSRLVTGVWFEPRVLLRRHLGGSLREYFARQVGAFILWTSLALVAAALGLLPDGPWRWAATSGLVASLPLIAWVIYGRTQSMQALRGRLTQLRAPA